MKKFSPSELKFLRASDILNYANINTNEIISSLKKVLGDIYYYYFIDASIENVFKFDVKSVGDDKFLTVSIEDNQDFTFIDSVGLSTSKNDECATFSIVYDENSSLNGSQSNPINIPISILDFENAPFYSKGLFSYVYVNGHPQSTTEYNFTQEEDKIVVYFTRLKQGKIAPLPKNKNGKFNKNIVAEIFWSEFKNDFCINNNPSNCYIEFPLINLSASNKDLVLEVKLAVNNWLNVMYYHVPKDFPVYNSQIFYKVSEDSPNKILINLSSLPLDPNDKLSFYFVEKLPSKKFDSNNIVTYQYYLPVQNISSETFNYIKVLALNSVTGMMTNLMEFNESLLTKVVDISLNGTLNINSAFLYGPDTPIYAFDYITTSPLPIYVSLDMPNNITFAGKLGGSIRIPNTDSEKHYKLYVKNIEVPEFGQTFYNSLSKKTSQVSIKNIRPYFLIAEHDDIIDNSFMFIGEIVVNGTNFNSFIPNFNISINDFTQLLNKVNDFNSILQNINSEINDLKNNKVQTLYTEIYGTTYAPNSSRPPILESINNLFSTVGNIQFTLSTLITNVNNINIINIQDQINLINNSIDNLKDYVHFSELSRKTNEKGIFILNKDIINTFLVNREQNIMRLLNLLENLSSLNYDFYIIPVTYQEFITNIQNLSSFLRKLKNIYITNTNKNLPKPVLLIIFNNYIDRNDFSINLLPNVLKDYNINSSINIGLQVEPTYKDTDNNDIKFDEVRNVINRTLSLLTDRVFIFSNNLQNLHGLLPKEIIDNSILLTSSRYAWKKIINSKDIDFSNYYTLYVVDDLFDLSSFCTSTEKIAFCDLIPNNIYSDLSFLDLSIDTSNSTFTYNNSYDIINAYLKAKNFKLITTLEFRDFEMFGYKATTDLNDWNLVSINGAKSLFLELNPKIRLYNIDANNSLTNTELSVITNNDHTYKLYTLLQNDTAGNIFEVTNNLAFSFNNAEFNASILINGILDFLDTYNNLIYISLNSGALSITDASDNTNLVSYNLPNNTIHTLHIKFIFDIYNNKLYINAKIYNDTLYLTLNNINYPLTSMLFKVTNLASNNLLISKLYV